MKKIYVCSRLAADNNHSIEDHINLAKQYCREIIDKWKSEGYLPIAPHLYFTQFMDDDNEIDRNLAFYFNSCILKTCDEIWIFCDEDGISKGMEEEIKLAIQLKILVKYVGEPSFGDQLIISELLEKNNE